jgi:hypothetical protein
VYLEARPYAPYEDLFQNRERKRPDALSPADNQQISSGWWEKRKGGFQLFISQLVADEAS